MLCGSMVPGASRWACPSRHGPRCIYRFCNWLVAPPHRGIHHINTLCCKHS